MFTGIIEAIGRVQAISSRARGTQRVAVSTILDMRRVPVGASIAVDGVCLTVIARRVRRFEADLGPETLARTTLGRLRPGACVHLERPLRFGAPLGGHLLTGHVDGVGHVRRRWRRGDALDLVVEAPAAAAAYLQPKGSVALDGVSLAVNRVRGRRFSVTLVPHTLAVTRLGERKPGDRVNLEVDLVDKHIVRFLKRHAR